MLTHFLRFIEFYSLSIYPEIEEILKVSVKNLLNTEFTQLPELIFQTSMYNYLYERQPRQHR